MDRSNGTAAAPANRLFLHIEPLDTLFFRDARPFDPASRAASGLPRPQTLAGALRTAMLREAGVDLDAVAGGVRQGRGFQDAAAAAGALGGAIGAVRFAGPWFARDEKPLFPAPATLKRERESKAIVRLDPLNSALPGWAAPQDGMVPLWRTGRGRLENAAGYLTSDGMTRFLDGGVPNEIVPGSELFGHDDRTGIAVDPGRATAAEGMIYAVRMLALRPGVRLCAELAGPAEALDLFPSLGALVALGGEGRRAVAVPAGKPPTLPSADAADRRLLVLTAPAPLDGWLPRGLALAAAAVPGHEAVSGWDLARGGPKPNRFMVPAGTVYFLKPGAVLPDSRLPVDPDDRALGWGSYLEGSWTYA